MSRAPFVRWCSVGMCAAVVALWCMLAPLLASAEQFTGKVVGISDGDTISVLRDGKAVKVRLYGVDAPEQAQAFGTQARKFTGDLAFQQTVTVAIRATDRYGRLVGEVLLPDARNLGQELVRAGLAWWYRQYAPKDTALAQGEVEAKAARRGLWQDPHAVPPWEYRHPRGARAAAVAVSPRSAPTPQCCKTCRSGQACGDTCIPHSQTCTQLSGCACQG